VGARVTRLRAILLGDSCRMRTPAGTSAESRLCQSVRDFVYQWTTFRNRRRRHVSRSHIGIGREGRRVASRFGELPVVRPAAESRRIHKMFQVQIFLIRSMTGVFVRRASERHGNAVSANGQMSGPGRKCRCRGDFPGSVPVREAEAKIMCSRGLPRLPAAGGVGGTLADWPQPSQR